VQIRLYSYYKAGSVNSSEVTVRIPSVRGEIRDRNGLVFVSNSPSYEVDFYLPDLVTGYKKQYGQTPLLDFQQRDSSGMIHERKEADIVQIVDQTIIPRLEELKMAEPYNAERLRTHYRNNTLVPFTYREDLDFATFSKFAEKDLGLPGVQMTVRPVRKYVYNAMAAQILRYVSAPKDINKLPDVRTSTSIRPMCKGRTNIEYFMDDVCRVTQALGFLRKRQKPDRGKRKSFSRRQAAMST
jgi:penicillin-binding protein 2